MAAAIYGQASTGDTVQSAGLAAADGAGASAHAAALYPALATHTAQPVTPELLSWADRVYAMTAAHRDRLPADPKITCLGEEDVADPFGGSLEEYTETARQIQYWVSRHLSACSSQFSITPMGWIHLDDVTALEQTVFTEPWPADAFRSELRNPLAVYKVIEYGGTAAGYAGFHTVLDEAHITNIAVAPEYRRRGIGKRLCQALIRAAARRNAAVCTLEVREGNHAALSLYGQMDFQIVGRRKGYYRSPAEDALLLTRTGRESDEHLGF
jgi:ribosomal-protein-alanine N-acetyltransferase